MHTRRGCAADQQRDTKTLPLHFLRDMRHLFQRRRNQSGQADDVGVMFARGVEYLLARHHHAHVYYFKVIALQHHGDDVFADVMHIALHRRHHDFALGLVVAGTQFFRFDVRHQMRHRLLHHACGFHHLWQKHFACAEQIADYIHAGHQRAFNYLDREARLQARFFGVLDDVSSNAAHQRVGEAFLHRALAPFQVFDLRLGAGLDGLCHLHQFFARVGVAVQHHIFHSYTQVLGDLFVHTELPGVNNPHGHARFDGVIQEHGVDRFAHRIVAAERERHIGHAATDLRVRQMLFYPRGGFDEIHRVVVVLLNAGGDGKNIRIENNVFGQEPDLLHQNVITAFADFCFALECIRLALLVERHHHRCRAIAFNQLGRFDERGFAFLEADRIHHRLALHAFQPGLDHVPFRRIYHQRHARNVRLGGEQINKPGHCRLRIQHRFVHVDVDNLRAIFHLLARHADCFSVIAVQDQPRKHFRAGDVGALADVDEQRVVADVERLQPGQAQLVLDVRNTARRQVFKRLGDGLDMRGRSAATTTGNIQETAGGEFLDHLGGVFGCFVITGFRQRIGQAGVRVGTHITRRDTRQFFHIRAHQIAAQRAVQPDGQRLGMRQRIPESLGSLTRQRAPGSIGDGAGNHDRHAHLVLLEILFDREQRSLGVEGIENGFHHQNIRAAIQQAAYRLGVTGHQFIKIDIAETRIVHVRRDRRGARGRPQHARDEARLVCAGIFITNATRQFGTGKIQFISQLHHVVIAQRCRSGVERASLDDVGTRRQIFCVNATNDVRLGQ